MSKKKKNSELVRLLCWSCGKRVKVPIKFAGKTGTCPKCKAKIQIPSLKTIKSTIKELEAQQNKQNTDALKDIDFPSLPSLKTIVLEDTDPQSPAGNKMAFSVKPPTSAEGTAEMLMNSGSTEMSDFDISGDLDNFSGEDIDVPAFEELGKVAVPPTRAVTPDDQFITSADAQFYNELASNSGVEQTETWAESQDVNSVDDEDSDIFHTPSYDGFSDKPEADAFNESSFDAEPLDNDFIFGDDGGDQIADMAEPVDDFAQMADEEEQIANAEPINLDEDIDFAQPAVENPAQNIAMDVQPIASDGEDFVPAEDFDFEVGDDIDIAAPLAADAVQIADAVDAIQTDVQAPIAVDALAVDPLPDNQEDEFDIDIESVTDVDVEEIDDDIDEIDDDIDDISSSSVAEAVEEDFEEGEDFEIEGSEVFSEDGVDDVADAVFVNEGEKSELEVSDEGFSISYQKIMEEENFVGSSQDINLGWQSFQKKEWEKAYYHFTKSIVENNDAMTGYYIRSLLFACEQSWEKARKDISFAKKLGYHRADVENRYNQIVFHQAKKHWEEGAFTKALEVLNTLETKSSQILKGKVFWKRAQLLMSYGAQEQALSDVGDALFHNYVKPELFMMRGKIYFLKGDYEPAIYDFTAAISHSEKNALLLRARAEAYYYIGKYDEALQDINEAISLDAGNAALYSLKGLLLTKKNDFAQAEQAFDEAINLDPNNSNYYFNRGLAYIIQKRYDRAIDDFTKVTQFKQDKAAYFKRAICYQEKPNPNLIQAREDFKTADNAGTDTVYRTDLFQG